MTALRGESARFNILGTLEVWHREERVHLGGARSQGVLAALLLEANYAVPLTRLIEAAWEHTPPATAGHQVRKAVADLRSRVPGGQEIFLTEGTGYRVVLGENQLDLIRFEQALARAATVHDVDAQISALESAVGLYRGRVLPDSKSPLLTAAATMIEARYLGAREKLLALQLDRGHAHDVVVELQALVTEHPLRESLTSQLMVALYRVGRQADALRAYHILRDALSDQLGIDPGNEAEERYQQILCNAPDLYPAPHPTSRPANDLTLAKPRTLPHDLPDFTGREAEIAWLLSEVGARNTPGVTVILIDGMGGSGKSTFAVHASHLLAERFPDGQIFMDLQGFTPGCEPVRPSDALTTLLRTIGVPSDRIPENRAEREGLWRGMTAGRRLLLLLDNVFASDQVRSLIPSGTHSLVLVTSRSRLLGLDGGSPMTLGLPSPADGQLLLANVIGRERVEKEPEAAAELVRLCARLPLALRIAAARLSNRPQWSLAWMVGRLRNEQTRLSELVADHRSVRVALEMSCESMTDMHRQLFQCLGVHPGPDLDAHTAAALGGLPLETTQALLEDLLDARLLIQRQPGRFALHDLVRSLAREGAERDPAMVSEARHRVLDYYLHVADVCAQLVQPGRERLRVRPRYVASTMPPVPDLSSALSWFETERQNLLAALAHAEDAQMDAYVANLPRVLAYYLRMRGHIDDELMVLRKALAAAQRLGDLELEGVALTNLAVPYWHLGHVMEGMEYAKKALAITERVGDRLGYAFCLSRIGMFCNTLGKYEDAMGHLHEALVIFQEAGNLREVGTVLASQAVAQTALGRYADARRISRLVIANSREIGDPYSEIVGLTGEAAACAQAGDFALGLERLNEATELAERIGTPNGRAAILAQYSDIYRRQGRYDDALRDGQAALMLLRNLHRPSVEAAVHNVIGSVHCMRGQLDLASEHHQDARRIAQKMGLRGELARALDGIADTHRRAGDIDARGHRALSHEFHVLLMDPTKQMGDTY